MGRVFGLRTQLTSKLLIIIMITLVPNHTVKFDITSTFNSSTINQESISLYIQQQIFPNRHCRLLLLYRWLSSLLPLVRVAKFNQMAIFLNSLARRTTDTCVEQMRLFLNNIVDKNNEINLNYCVERLFALVYGYPPLTANYLLHCESLSIRMIALSEMTRMTDIDHNVGYYYY